MDMGGAINRVLAGLFIFVPMWLLLVVSLLCVTAAGGFDWLPANRVVLYAFVVFAAASMAVISAFLRFEPSGLGRLLHLIFSQLPLQVFPALTILLVILCLNPRPGMGIPLKSVIFPWFAIAAFNMAFCGGYVGYRLVLPGRNRVQIALDLIRHWNFNAKKELLAEVSELYPRHDFVKLVALCDCKSRAVREAAIAKI